MHYNGTEAKDTRSNLFGDIVSVWGTDPSNVLFLTNKNTLVRFNGTTYSESSPVLTGVDPQTMAIGGSGTSAWVGGAVNGKPAIFSSQSGGAFLQQTLDSNFLGNQVDLIYALSPTMAWAAGYPAYNVIRWNGTQWITDVSYITDTPITGLWASSASDVWVSSEAKLHRFNGSTWAVVPAVTGNLSGVHGSSASDIWVGDYRAAWHYDGTRWTKLTIPGSTTAIVSVRAISATDAWFGDTTGALFRWDGTTFRRIDSGASDTGTAMRIFAADAKNVWFGGQGILSYRR